MKQLLSPVDAVAVELEGSVSGLKPECQSSPSGTRVLQAREPPEDRPEALEAHVGLTTAACHPAVDVACAALLQPPEAVAAAAAEAAVAVQMLPVRSPGGQAPASSGKRAR